MQNIFHAAAGRADFLGMRPSRRGGTEIVYEDGAARRMVWRVAPQTGGDDLLGHISDAMRLAVAAPNILCALYSELENRAVAITRL